MHQNLLFITDERIQRLLRRIDSILKTLENQKIPLIHVKSLANVVGQIISLQSVVGNKVRLMTRGLFACINTRASWNAPVLVTQGGINELHFWKNNIEKLNEIGKHIKDECLGFYSVYLDASRRIYCTRLKC